jgi:hypothetical protein
MIRPFTLICMLIAMGAGFYSYQSKHESQVLDRKIATIVRATDETRTRIGMLRADYQLLNDPTRLQGLADQQLTLKAIAPTQFTTMAELARRLPPVDLAPHTAPEPVPEPDVGLFVPPAEPIAAVVPVAPKPVAVPPSRQAALPVVTPTPPPLAPTLVAKPVKPAPEAAVHPAQVPQRRPAPPPVLAAQLPLAQPSVQQASAIRPVSDSRPAFVSALGMARTLPRSSAVPSAGYATDVGGGR